MKIAVVILNWNGAALLKRFLPSVVAHSKEATIYVADNGSTDDSEQLIAIEFPEVQWIGLPNNLGFAGGYNEALKSVKEPLYCLLNSDVEVTENWLTPVLELFNSNSEIAIAQPKILDYIKKTHFEYAGAAGGYLDAFGYPYCRGRLFQSIEEDLGQYNDTRQIFWATGACMFIRAEVFKKLGGFDARFFAHQEEIDLCWRANNIGLKVFYIGTSSVYHLGGSTLSNMNPKKTFLNFRNSLYSILKNCSPIRAIIVIVSRLILDGIAGVVFLVQGKRKHTWAIVLAHFSFYRYAISMYKSRFPTKHKALYAHTFSIIVVYFLRRKEKFSELVKD